MRYFAFAILILQTSFAFGASPNLDFPILDEPMKPPTMRQSLALSTDFYEGLHYAIAGGDEPHPRAWRRWTIIGVDVLSTWLPFGSSWMHEEWHRAVMARRNIASYNDVYNFPIGQDLIAVSHVLDEDLIRLKKDHPAEQVRLSAAGMESQVVQNHLVERHHFFDDIQTDDTFMLWMNAAGVTSYLWTCGTHAADTETDKSNTSDGANIAKRDFTGLDCTAWAYDLFRPDEPYTARGVHPSGVGVNRYIHYKDLTGHEQAFLDRQTPLSFFNFIDPFLFRRTHFDWDGTAQWNARTSHYLTSFGYTVDADFLWRNGSRKFQLTLHNGFNDKTYYPGLTAEMIDYPLSERWRLTSKLTLWNQPRGQRFDAQSGSLLTAASAQADYLYSACFAPYAGVEAKTPGWIAGNVFLERALTLYAGFTLRL